MTEIKPVLEPAAQAFADATANPPQLYDLPVAEGRKMVDSVQDGDIPAPPVDVERFGYKRAGMTTVDIESSHLVMLSHPKEVADLIRTAISGS